MLEKPETEMEEETEETDRCGRSQRRQTEMREKPEEIDKAGERNRKSRQDVNM